MKTTFFLTIALIASVVSAGITQVQNGGTGGSDKSGKGGLLGTSLLNGDNAILGKTEKKTELNMEQNANGNH
ncbi:hypothetical protein K492DRAFT_197817 [Lichtheimia hyalospora FSU 10163]|nr:hypothetical protein K492DRAFT_197817 [Lichtheimia hyalospora FSU 10163]